MPKLNDKHEKRAIKYYKELEKLYKSYPDHTIPTGDPSADRFSKKLFRRHNKMLTDMDDKLLWIKELNYVLTTPQGEQGEEFIEAYKNMSEEELRETYEDISKEIADYLEKLVDVEKAFLYKAKDIVNRAEDVVSQPKVSFKNNKTVIPSHRTVKSILNAIYDACEGKVISKEDVPSRKGWYEENDIPVYEDRWGNNESITITLDDEIKPTETLQKKLSSFREVMADVFTGILCTFLNSHDPHNGFWVKVSHMLDYRGLEPVMKGKQRAGHRKEDREEIIHCISLLNKLTITFSNVTAYPENGKKTSLSFDSKIISIIENAIEYDLQGNRSGFKITFGDYGKFLYGENKRQTALISEKALHYDPYKEKWEKRISYYLTFQWKIKSSHDTIDNPFRVETLLKEAVREEINRRFPARVRDRLEKALDKLRADGEITYWEYEKDDELPVKNWLPLWLNWNVRIDPPDWVEEQYESVREKRLKLSRKKKNL